MRVVKSMNMSNAFTIIINAIVTLNMSASVDINIDNIREHVNINICVKHSLTKILYFPRLIIGAREFN